MHDQEPLPDTAARDELSVVTWIILIGVVVGGVYLRIDGFSNQSIHGDELHAAPQIARGFDKVRRTFDMHGSHLGLPVLQHFAGEAFGMGVRSYRLPVLIAGILSLLLLFPIARTLVGPIPAWLTTLVLAVHPAHVYYSRFARAYSLIFLLALVFVFSLLRAMPSPGGRWRVPWCLVVVMLGTAMLVSHLCSAGVLAGCGVASFVIAWRRGRKSDLWIPVVLFAAMGLLAAALYAPSWERGLKNYLERLSEPHFPRPSAVGVASLMGGGPVGGIVLSSLVLVGIAFLRRLDAERALLLLAAALGPVLVLLGTRPAGGVDGGTLAYMRYLFAALPFLVMLAFWGLEQLLGTYLPRAAARPGVRSLGLAVVVCVGIDGPLWNADLRRGQFTNSYTALRSNPALDVPFHELPAFYEEIAAGEEPVVLIEYPVSRDMEPMLRNYGLLHGHETLVGLHFTQAARGRGPAIGPRAKERESSDILLNGPYVELPAADLNGRLKPGYVVLHTNVEAEIAQYQAFVSTQGDLRRWSERLLDSRQYEDARQLRERRARAPTTLAPASSPSATEMLRLRLKLEQRFGMPVYQDDFIEVWKVHAPAPELRGEEAPRR